MYLWNNKLTIKEDKVSCGYGGEDAIIEVYVCGKSGSASEPLV